MRHWLRRSRAIASLLFAIFAVGCAAAVQRPSVVAPATIATAPAVVTRPQTGNRPVIGVAFGGGSARGIAHVGVIRWFEEHRIPIDVAAGTSMGGLLGGAFASGMDADELDAWLASIDWDAMFGSSAFAFKNIRRKVDNRAFPSRLEFGLKRGLVPPTSLNNGEQVELLISRLVAPYADITHFDQAVWRTNASLGVFMDTLLGAVLFGGSAGFDGRWPTFFGVGRIFR